MFILRLMSSIVLISVFLFSIINESMYARTCFTVIAIVLGFVASLEFLRMLDKLNKPSYPIITGIFSSAILVSVLSKTNYIFIYLTFSIITIFIIFCWFRILVSKSLDVLETVINSAAAIFMVILPLSFICVLYMKDYQGRNLLLYLILVTKSGDIGAYCVGMTTNKIMKGNHKIIPSISPKKSWEGTIGGMIVSVILSYFLWNKLNLSNQYVILVPVVLGVVLFVGGFVGDLAESSFKRICGVKDSGNIIPGIGGTLDLLDSLLLNAPVFTLFCLYSFS